MRTKTLLLLNTMVIFVVGLAACSGTSDQTASTTSTSGASSSQTNTSLSQVNMLLVGTLKLEDTDQAVTTDEAAKLLPLWQAYRSLSTSQTAAEAEVIALLNQIQSTMTAEQVQAIKAMNLTNTDMMNLMQTMGAGMGPRGTPNPQSTPGFDLPSGGFPSGNPPSGSSGDSTSGGQTRGDMPGGGAVVIQGGPGVGGDAGSAAGLGGGPMLQGTQDPSMQATAQARFSTQASQVNSILLDVLITKLEAKTTN
jgi:hypothetical protein